MARRLGQDLAAIARRGRASGGGSSRAPRRCTSREAPQPGLPHRGAAASRGRRAPRSEDDDGRASRARRSAGGAAARRARGGGHQARVGARRETPTTSPRSRLRARRWRASADSIELKRRSTRAIALDPGRTAVLLAAAALRAQQEKTDQALELATLAATRDARSPEAKVAVARYQASLGRDQEAAASARQALELAPHSAPAEIAYADLVERREGELAAAETRLRHVVDREPLLPEGWLALGAVVESAHGADAAISIYAEGLERQPASGQLHAALGVLLAQERRPEAEQHLRRAAELIRPAPASVERGLALVAIGQRDWKGAESAARRLSPSAATTPAPGRCSPPRSRSRGAPPTRSPPTTPRAVPIRGTSRRCSTARYCCAG